MQLTKEEKEFVKKFVESEIKAIEKFEEEFPNFVSNSPVLSQLVMRDTDLLFLASSEKYADFLKKLHEKLK